MNQSKVDKIMKLVVEYGQLCEASNDVARDDALGLHDGPSSAVLDATAARMCQQIEKALRDC